MKVHVYIYGNINTPSSRLRWINYEKYFEKDNIEYKVFCINDYIRNGSVIKSPENADIIIIQKKAQSPRIIDMFKQKAKKIIFDIDDAIWIKHSSRLKNDESNINTKININLKYTLEKVDIIISANKFIADFIKQYNNNVVIIPTSPSDKDISSNIPEKIVNTDGKFIVGWTGSGENLFYIKEIEKYIKDFFIENKNAYLMIISNKKYISDDSEFNKKIINIGWSLINESYYLNKFDIGIMPSTKDEWALGKAAYKLIYYMKKEIPVIGTNWGFQTEFIQNGINGYLVENNYEWKVALNDIFNNEEKASIIKDNALKTYNELFNSNIIYKKYLDAMKIEKRY